MRALLAKYAEVNAAARERLTGLKVASDGKKTDLIKLIYDVGAKGEIHENRLDRGR